MRVLRRFLASFAKHDECTAKAAAKGSAAVQKLVAKGLLPSCLDGTAAQTLVSTVAGLGGAYTGQISCQ